MTVQIRGRRWIWAQPFHTGGLALLLAGGAAIPFAVAFTDPSAPLWGRGLAAGLGIAGLGVAGFILAAGVVVAGPEGIASYQAWRQRRRWISWDEVESFGTYRFWSEVGVVLKGGEFQILVPVMSLLGSIDSVIVVLVMAPFLPKRPPGEGTVRRLVGRIADVRYQHTGDAGSEEVVFVEVPPRLSGRAVIGGRNAHNEPVVTGGPPPFLLPSERANKNAASRRSSRSDGGNVDT